MEFRLGGFAGGSTTVCVGRCNLRATFLTGLRTCLFVALSVGGTGVVKSATSSAITALSTGGFPGSNHWERAARKSSNAAHPPRPKLADKVVATSAMRAGARICEPRVGPPAVNGGPPQTGQLVSAVLGEDGQTLGVHGQLAPPLARLTPGRRPKLAGSDGRLVTGTSRLACRQPRRLRRMQKPTSSLVIAPTRGETPAAGLKRSWHRMVAGRLTKSNRSSELQAPRRTDKDRLAAPSRQSVSNAYGVESRSKRRLASNSRCCR
jgi:hypothetical protein